MTCENDHSRVYEQKINFAKEKKILPGNSAKLAYLWKLQGR